MQIEFRNCSLEIGYIGTSDQIMIAMIRDACQVAADAIIDFTRRFVSLLEEAFERGAEKMRAWLAEEEVRRG